MPGNCANQALREVIEAIASELGNDFFGVLAKSLFRRLGRTYPFVGEVGQSEQISRAYAGGVCLDNMEYTLAGTPCANVVGNRSMWHIPMGYMGKGTGIAC